MPNLFKASIFFVLSLLAITAFPVLAQDTATPSSVRKQLLQRNVEARKEKVENKVSTLKEKEASRVAAFKTKLQTFENQTKVSTAERINTNLNLVNQKQTTQLQKFLTTMTSILDKLETRVNKGTPDIKDPVAAKAAITAARQSIASASAAIIAQAQKDYTIEVTTESKLKADAKNQRDKLHADLQAVKKTVIAAKQSVANAIRTVKAEAAPVKGVTSSGQP